MAALCGLARSDGLRAMLAWKPRLTVFAQPQQSLQPLTARAAGNALCSVQLQRRCYSDDSTASAAITNTTAAEEPEAKPKARRGRRPRTPEEKAAAAEQKAAAAAAKASAAADAAEADKVKPIRRRRRTKAEMEAEDPDRSVRISRKNNSPVGRRKKLAASTADAQPFKVFGELDEETQARFRDHPLVHNHLPLPFEWPLAFAKAKGIGRQFTSAHTFFVSNKNTVQRMVDSLELEKGAPKTILEVYPGPGVATRAFLAHPNVEKVIAIENHTGYTEWFLRLMQDPTVDTSKLHFLKDSGFHWEAYSTLFRQGAFDHLTSKMADGPTAAAISGDGPESETGEQRRERLANAVDPSLYIPQKSHKDADWQAECPIIFFAQLPNSVHGELLFVQLTNAIAERSWLHQLGRIKMAFVCSESIMRRITAPPGDAILRNRISTTTQLLADIDWYLQGDELIPFKDHVYPPTGIVGLRMTKQSSEALPADNVSSGMTKQALSFGVLTPKREPLLDRELFETYLYLARKLFVVRAKRVDEALKTAAPGGDAILSRVWGPEADLVEKEGDAVDPRTPVYELTNQQWVSLTKAFDLWPFKPSSLLEEGFVSSDVSRRW